jgi:glutamate 5-kinase
MQLKASKRIVIKTGSSLMTGADGALREAWLASVAEDIAGLRAAGKDVVIVTSGAVALGRPVLGLPAPKLALEEKQAAAACGQPLLMRVWREALAAHHLPVAQLLLTIDDSENRRRYLNARNTLETLLSLNAVPVINENDTVATAELRFGDNDRLAARVAQMVSADALILLSDIDGLYTANPRQDKAAKFVPEVQEITPQVEAMAGGTGSSSGSGGMITKVQAAKIAVAAGCHMAIAAGTGMHPVRAAMEGGKATWFLASATPKSARKHWISGAIAPSGAIVVDAGAAAALKAGKSLLPAGAKAAEGTFERGDAVLVKDETGALLGRGLVAYSAQDAQRILGRKSSEIEKILGFKGRDTLIHRDDLALD